jgi:hypothetical protein
VRDWPPIAEPELLERLALDDDQFRALFRKLVGSWGVREYTPEALEQALAYPWKRPARSYLLRGAEVQLLADLEPQERKLTVDTHARERHPIIAFGSNAAPERLELKFAHFPDEVDRSLLVLAGELHGFDVGPAASIAPYGAMPATLFESPATAVRAAVLWLTVPQVTQLTWSEVPYRLGRLDAARFVVESEEIEVDRVFAFIHRFGSLCIDGAPVALAAVPGSRRNQPAWTQEELLNEMARRLLTPDARAADLVRAVFEDMGALFERVSQRVWPSGRALRAELWTPYPAG